MYQARRAVFGIGAAEYEARSADWGRVWPPIRGVRGVSPGFVCNATTSVACFGAYVSLLTGIFLNAI